MNLTLSLSTPQRHPGREPVSALLFPLICFLSKNILCLTFRPFSCECQSLGPPKWGPGIMSRHSRAGCSAKGYWGLGRVRSTIYWDASCDWNHFAHVVQLPASLVGERSWELPWDGGPALHWCHIRTPQSTSGQHHENCSQQFGNWWGLLDEEVGWWALLYTPGMRLSFHLSVFSRRWDDIVCFLS